MNLQDNNSINLYKLNKEALSFLPSLFVVINVLGIFALAFFITNSLINNRDSIIDAVGISQTRNTLPKELVAQNNASSPSYDWNALAFVDTNASTEENNTLPSESVNLNIEQTGLSCNLVSTEKPSEQLVDNLFTTPEKQNWFAPIDRFSCLDKSLLYIQIITGSNAYQAVLDQRGGVSKNVELLHTIEDQQIIAIVYTKDSQSTQLELKRYAPSLASNLLDLSVFEETSASFTRRLGDFTFYEKGECQNLATINCLILKRNNFSSQAEIVANLKSSDFSDLQTYSDCINLRFAKEQQTFGQNLDLICTRELDNDYSVVVFRLPLNSLHTKKPSLIGEYNQNSNEEQFLRYFN